MDDRTDRSVRAGAEPDHAAREQALFAVMGDLVRELHPARRASIYRGRAGLERDLGIDSLARTELILRIERAFRVRLPVGASARRTRSPICSPRSTGPAAGEHSDRAAAAPIAAALPLVPAATEARTLDGGPRLARRAASRSPSPDRAAGRRHGARHADLSRARRRRARGRAQA